MCGIVGKYNFRNGEPVPEALIQTMCDRIEHRGPDDWGVYTYGPIGIGHRRLSILDLSMLGHQPMSSEDRTIWISYNGEVYNFQALRKDLVQKGYRFKSECDTEVLIYLYKEYGEACLDYLRGMFAFAIWNQAESKLFLARDRIGKKPLFYYYDGNCLLFASEIKSILADPMIQKKINYEAFYDYFKYLYVPDPKTIYENIHKLEPGHCLTVSRNDFVLKQYWDVSFSDTHPADEEAICDELLYILGESTKLRMISDVPLGAFLSGGIDSSGIVAMMAMASERPVKTCSIGFDSEKFDEIRFARLLSKKYRTDHHEFTVKQKAAEILFDLAYFFDEPFADSSAVPMYYVSKLARETVTVALSGDGGDENFAGYEKYFLDDIENRFRSQIPLRVRQRIIPVLAEFASRWRQPSMKSAATLLNTLQYDAGYGFYLTNSEFENHLWQRLINDDLRQKINGYDPANVTLRHYAKADTDNHLSKILYTDLKTYLPGDILVKVDRMSMAHSLEVRAPILDHHMIEFAASIPPDLKYSRGNKKYVLKKALDGVLPDEILYRKKMGFTVPLAEWLRGELRELADQHLIRCPDGLGYFFNLSEILSLWDEHQSNRTSHATILWTLLMFELWFKRFIL